MATGGSSRDRARASEARGRPFDSVPPDPTPAPASYEQYIERELNKSIDEVALLRARMTALADDLDEAGAILRSDAAKLIREALHGGLT